MFEGRFQGRQYGVGVNGDREQGDTDDENRVEAERHQSFLKRVASGKRGGPCGEHLRLSPGSFACARQRLQEGGGTALGRLQRRRERGACRQSVANLPSDRRDARRLSPLDQTKRLGDGQTAAEQLRQVTREASGVGLGQRQPRRLLEQHRSDAQRMHPRVQQLVA
ncbi:hypothetical protein D3C86_1063350 [compost metagenome]